MSRALHRAIRSALGGFVLGVALGSWGGDPVVALACGCGALLLAMGSLTLPPRIVGLACLAALGAASGFWHMASIERFWASGQPPELGESIVRVAGFPETKDAYVAVRLAIEACPEDACPNSSKEKAILWQAPRGTSYQPGDRFRFSCPLEEPENFDPAFDYRRYLAKEGIGYVCREGIAGERLPPGIAGRLWQPLASVREAAEHGIEALLTEPEAGLGKGLLLGGSGFLDTELEAAFRRVGLSHIVAVSGYNILLVAGFCFGAGSWMGLWRRHILLLSLGGVFLFVLLVGAPASAVRAGVMVGVLFAGFWAGRMTDFAFLLLAALSGMLLFNPLLLRSDIGFQLSFLAVLGIAAASWHGRFTSPPRTWWRLALEAARVTLWVELFVLPLVLYYFGTLSWVSLPANVILLPLIPFAMLASLLAALAGTLLPPGLALLFAWPALVPLTALTRFAETVGGASWAALEDFSVGGGGIALWYALLAGVCWYRYFRHQRKWYATAFLRAP